LGKDFIAALIALKFFCTRHPVKVITTSATEKHLNNLWGEIDRFIRTSRKPMLRNGQLVYNFQHLRKRINAVVEEDSYMMAVVASSTSKGEGLQGHHSANTLVLGDESSGLPDIVLRMAQTWAHRQFWFGNPWPSSNFFLQAIEQGDILDPAGGYYRKIIEMAATDSPNVKLGLEQQARGEKPTNEVKIPGLVTWRDYQVRLATLDKVSLCVSVYGKPYKGAEILLFPPEWLNAAQQRALELAGQPREARALGCDPGEGTARTAWSIVDEYGLIELVSLQTPDTSDVPNWTIALGKKHGIQPENWIFDRGGGGKQHADGLRQQGYNVRTVAFGEGLLPDIKKGYGQYQPYSARLSQREEKYAYVNRRAQMYGELSLLLDPSTEPIVGATFAIPFHERLRKQLSVMPKLYDQEGRMFLPPKQKKPGQEEAKVKSLTELIGHSPDEADSLALAVFGMIHPAMKIVAGPIR
jgi:hypothetical protein